MLLYNEIEDMAKELEINNSHRYKIVIPRDIIRPKEVLF